MRMQRNLNRIPYHWTVPFICINKNFHFRSPLSETCLKDKSGIDEIIAEKQPYQLLNTNREFFPTFDASSFHKLVNESS